jgi:ribosomal protein S18 acetylase RimI-like enzyme
MSKTQPVDLITETLNMLKSEDKVQRRHIELLEEQRIALLAGDEARFAACYENYEVFLLDLEQQANLRKQVLPDENISLRSEMMGWPAAKRKAGYALLDSITLLVEKVKRLADQNCGMVSNQLNYIQFMMSVMVRASRGNQTYAPKGRTSPIHAETLFVNHMA